MTRPSIILWVVALLLTIASAVFQRVTGPTYPLRGSVTLEGKEISYKLDRSEEQRNAIVRIPTGNPSIRGWVAWKRYRSDDPWVASPMIYQDNFLLGELP